MMALLYNKERNRVELPKLNKNPVTLINQSKFYFTDF